MSTETGRVVTILGEDGNVLDRVQVQLCWGRDSRGEVVRYECATSYLVYPDHTEATFFRAAAPKARGGFHDRGVSTFHDVVRGVILQHGRGWQEIRFGHRGEIASESALLRYEYRGPKALLPARAVA